MTEISRFNEFAPLYEAYYGSSYPFKLLVDWFTYHGTVDTSRREWSCEGLPVSGDKFVKRWIEIKNEQDLRNITQITNDIKLKFDIGPVYSRPMDTRKQFQPQPEWRELVFDIDADDYSTVRRCCTGKTMCNKCWLFMECAASVLCHFCQVYGFESYIFVFSGRRGMHCWICDEFARRLTAKQRLQLLFPFEIIKTENENEITMNIKESTVSGRLILDVCEVFFNKMVQDQGWINNPESYQKTVQALMLIAKGLDMNFSVPVNVKNTELIDYLKQKQPKLYKYLVIYFTYPRFDINVTKSMNHLLKAPFSVHSETKNISSPINHQMIIEENGLDKYIKFGTRINSLRTRFSVEKPYKMWDDITEPLAFFNTFVTSLKTK